jgi:hypothetical protein
MKKVFLVQLLKNLASQNNIVYTIFVLHSYKNGVGKGN